MKNIVGTIFTVITFLAVSQPASGIANMAEGSHNLASSEGGHQSGFYGRSVRFGNGNNTLSYGNGSNTLLVGEGGNTYEGGKQ